VVLVPWLPASFRAPPRLELPTGHHLRQIRASDLDIDHPAVMGSQPRLWSLFGQAWGWPPADLTREQDLEDLVRHVDEMERNLSFNYAILDADETRLLGCVYLDPPEVEGTDAEVTWWVVDDEVGGPVEACLLPAVRTWLAASWPFQRPRVVGWDLTWEVWSSS
jgi:RimJ/RimL family protein N-acetyltransferase